jgi:2-succinyl-5-enolpyruvyl-6-hydroxy-3-cyclohexene-1-carboxylate synthase
MPDPAAVHALAAFVRANPRGLLVAGWGSGVTPATGERFAAAAGWPVLADPLSGLRNGPHAVSTYEALLRAPGFGDRHRPDAVVRVGAPPTSKVLGAWLTHDIPTWLIDPDDSWLDPERATWMRAVCDADALLDEVARGLGQEREPTSAWLDAWRDAECRARRALDEFCDSDEAPFVGRVARDVVACLPVGASLVVASSMPVRDVEAFAAPRTGIDFFANRGVNGIDGFVSTVLGVAAARPRSPVIGLLGDLCFVHDSNGLIGAAERGIDAVLVVVDNDGGGIFSFLPYADSGALSDEQFQLLFATPHGVDLSALAAVHRVRCDRVPHAAELPRAIHAAIDAGGVRVVLVQTERGANVARHRAAWETVSAAVR